MVRKQTSSAQVHVFASPDEGTLDVDERLCSDGDSTDRERVRVVFHVRPAPTWQGWMCNACGYEGFDTEERSHG